MADDLSLSDAVGCENDCDLIPKHSETSEKSFSYENLIGEIVVTHETKLTVASRLVFQSSIVSSFSASQEKLN